MFQLRRILLSGLVALLMVGMVTASDVYSSPGDNDEVDRSYIGAAGRTGACEDTNDWDCVHLEFFIDFNLPW